LDKGEAINERVELLFYEVLEKKGKRLLKPLKLNTSVPVSVIKAVSSGTIADSFYQRLAKDLLDRGVAAGTLVQLRAKFSKSSAAIESAANGTHILCEIKV
jgi:hypothetical protein